MEYLIAIAVLVGAVAVSFLVVRAAARMLFGQDRRLERDLGAEVLRDRLSRGEITRAQFETAAAALGIDRTKAS